MPKIPTEVTTEKYSEESLQKALEEVRNGAPKRKVALKYGIPRATIQFRLGPKFSKVERGHYTYLTKEEETKIVRWLSDCQRKGFPKRKMDIQQCVKSFMDASNRPNPFKNNMPGDHWYKLFLKRHPVLAERNTEAVTSASANVCEKDIRGWFSEIETYLKQQNYFSILSDKSRVFNGDETCFLFCPKQGKALVPKGSKNVYEVDIGDAKQNLTVMFTFSASGDTTPPLIIYPNKRLPRSIAQSVPENWGVGLSDNGWMKSEIFIDYIKNIFHPYLKQTNIEFPVILFLDGHKTHLSYELSKLCSDLEVILIALYPNSTRILQPADVACFRPMKHFWKKAVLEWRQKNPYCKFTKEHFAPVLEVTLSSLKPETLIHGFKSCGLQPWNPDALDYTKCLGKQLITNNMNNHKENTREIIGDSDTDSNDNTENNNDITNDNREIENNNSSNNSNNENFNGVITLQNFTDLIGVVKLAELKSNNNMRCLNSCSTKPCENFVLLQKMYNILNNDTPIEVLHKVHNEANVSDSSNHIENVSLSNSNFPFSEQDFYNMPMDFSENVTPQPVMAEEVLIDSNDIGGHLGMQKVSLADENARFEDDVEPNNDSEEFLEYENEPDAINVDVSSCNPNIEQYLEVPRTPQRSGKHQTERTSFVLTSSAYKLMMEEKERLKEEKERVKHENREKRQRKALEKIEENMKKKEKKQEDKNKKIEEKKNLEEKKKQKQTKKGGNKKQEQKKKKGERKNEEIENNGIPRKRGRANRLE